MNITLRQLTYFKALAAARHFGRAAQMVHISQPALSVQIRELEATLGAPLVERHARDVVLTPFGRQALVQAERALFEVDRLVQMARWRGGLSGELRFGVIPTVAPYLLPQALAQMRAHDLSLDVKVIEGKTERLVAQLLDGTLDAAVMAMPIAAEGLEAVPLFEDRFLLAGSEARLAALGAQAESLRPRALEPTQLMLLEDGHCLTDQALEVCGHAAGQINTGASSLATLARLVEAGFGLTLMPEIAALSEQLSAPQMRLIRFAAPEPARQIALLRRHGSGASDWFENLASLLAQVGAGLTATCRAAV